MRTALRLLFTTLAVTSLILGGASAALAASDNLPSFTERYEFDDEWCLDYGDVTDCTVLHLTMVIQYKSSGDSSVRFNDRSVTVTTDNATGLVVATQRTSGIERTVYEDGSQSKNFVVSHTRYHGPDVTCISTYQLKIVGFGDVVVDRYQGPGCK